MLQEMTTCQKQRRDTAMRVIYSKSDCYRGEKKVCSSKYIRTLRKKRDDNGSTIEASVLIYICREEFRSMVFSKQ